MLLFGRMLELLGTRKEIGRVLDFVSGLELWVANEHIAEPVDRIVL